MRYRVAHRSAAARPGLTQVLGLTCEIAGKLPQPDPGLRIYYSSRESEVPDKSPNRKSLIVPDPNRKTYIDADGQKYWYTTGYYGRPIKMYGEPWRFRTTASDVIVPTIIFGFAAYAIYSAIFGD